jgi:ankyrin repeat protein
MEQGVLLIAIRDGDSARVKALVARNPDLLTTPTSSGASSVLWAVYTGHPEIAQWLIAAGAPVTIFEAAALGLGEDLTRRLASDPVSVNAFAPDGFTALGLAAFFGHREAVETLLAYGANPNQAANNAQRVAPLHSAAAQDRLAIARILIAHGADVNATQEGEVTSLQEAAHHGAVEFVRLLLGAGADIGARNQQGQTALDYAREHGNAEVIALLGG